MTTEHGQVAPATSGGGTAAPGDDLYFGPCLNPAGDPWDVALAEAERGARPGPAGAELPPPIEIGFLRPFFTFRPGIRLAVRVHAQ